MSELTIRLYEESQDNIDSLYYQAASEIDRLKAELEYTKEMSNAFMDERNNLKIQLAEARVEINRRDEFCGKCENGQLVALEQARQEAAKWVADLLFSPEWEKECHCCEDYYCSICRIKDEFKLEG